MTRQTTLSPVNIDVLTAAALTGKHYKLGDGKTGKIICTVTNIGMETA